MKGKKHMVKGWMFLTSENDIIPNISTGGDTVYFKKPNPIPNPFAYGDNTPTWKPTQVYIVIP